MECKFNTVSLFLDTGQQKNDEIMQVSILFVTQKHFIELYSLQIHILMKGNVIFLTSENKISAIVVVFTVMFLI